MAQLAAEGKNTAPRSDSCWQQWRQRTYVAAKVKACEEIGFRSTLIRFEDDIAAIKLLDEIQDLNNDPDVDGILVQLPLPKHIKEKRCH